MVICFGLSWPLSVYKSAKSRTAKGKSLFFEVFIWTGYVSAIIGKIVTQNLTYVFYRHLPLFPQSPPGRAGQPKGVMYGGVKYGTYCCIPAR